MRKFKKAKCLASEITALGALLASYHREKILKTASLIGRTDPIDIEKEKEKNVVLNILSYMSTKKVMDPLVLSACCQFSVNVLHCPEVIYEPAIIGPYFEAM